MGTLLLLAMVVLAGHDMFLKLPSYFLEERSPASIALINGTFAESENVINEGPHAGRPNCRA